MGEDERCMWVTRSRGMSRDGLNLASPGRSNDLGDDLHDGKLL